MRSAIRTVVALAVVSVLVASCGEGATPTPAPPATPARTAAPAPTPPATPARTAASTPTPALTTTPPPLPAPGTDVIQAARAVQSLHERFEAAWATKSVEAAMAFWSDDVSFTDVLGGWRDAPRTEVAGMIRTTNLYWPNAASGNLSYFLDATGLVLSADVWGLGDATEANPVHEVDQYETADGLITALHTSYTVESTAHIVAWFGNELAQSDVAAMEALVEAYADAWSSGDPSSVAQLYAETAWRIDKLSADSAEGSVAISDAAARYFGSYPGAVWRVDFVFGDDAIGGNMTGGIFTVALVEPDACELGAAVVLETNEGQKVVTERVYWELDSLIRCGQVASAVSAVPTN